MAKIKFGMMMTDARGKLGGQVFSKNKAGAYVRTKVTPTNPQTIFQTTARLLFAAISAGWSGLAESARLGWNEAVPSWATTDIFGDLKNPTGKELYQRLNNQAQSAGLAPVTSVPQKLEFPSDVVTSAVIDLSSVDIVVAGANADASTQIVIFATPPLTAGTSFVKNRLRQIYPIAGNVYSGTDAYSAYIAKFGAPLAGDNVYIGVKYVLANGQAAPMQVLKATVQA